MYFVRLTVLLAILINELSIYIYIIIGVNLALTTALLYNLSVQELYTVLCTGLYTSTAGG